MDTVVTTATVVIIINKLSYKDHKLVSVKNYMLMFIKCIE
jgi:hypothetical protein